MVKTIYLLPNMITTANLACGVLAMLGAIQGQYVHACWLIVVAAICDSLDGRVARMAKATTSFGVQYDSLSDLTSFGIAPAILMYTFALDRLGKFGMAIAVFYVVCAALRLARFNVTADEDMRNIPQTRRIRKGYFQGLPSPASAGIIISTLLFQLDWNWMPQAAGPGFFTFLTVALALFMVSDVPFPSFKDLNWRAKGKAWLLMVPVVIILCLIQAPEVTLFIIGSSYLIFSLGWSSYLCWVREKKSVPQGGH